MTQRTLRSLFAAGCGAAATASCTPRTDPPSSATVPFASSSATSRPSQAPASAAASARALGRDGPLEEGRVYWEGMVRPTKGGYDVRGVTLDGAVLKRELAASAIDGKPSDPDWFLGAVVGVTAELRKTTYEQPDGGPIVQSRQGTWFHATHVESIVLVAPAQVLEGVLGRSKGFFTLEGRLVTRSDLAWALTPTGGGNEGERVRLWGQDRVVPCEPNAQCLIGGSLPLFDVGRAVRLPLGPLERAGHRRAVAAMAPITFRLSTAVVVRTPPNRAPATPAETRSAPVR